MSIHDFRQATHMQAIAQDGFESPDVLELRGVPTPSPSAGEVLARVPAASPNPWDWHFMRGLPSMTRLAGTGLSRSPGLPLVPFTHLDPEEDPT
jgi:NADPH:quinone reductase-like Zn-dependent oxidoreductase